MLPCRPRGPPCHQVPAPPAVEGEQLPPLAHQPQAAGFTISPLMSKYLRLAGGEESQESLVTLVLKADMGGLISGA